MATQSPAPSTSPTPAQEWLGEFVEATRRFVSTRPIEGLTVKMTLANEREEFVQWMRAGPGPQHVTVGVYPESDEDMLETDDGSPTSPTALIVPLHSIAVVELMSEHPEKRTIGFHVPEQPARIT